MVHKPSGQLEFADTWLGNNPELNQRLDKINRLVDWRPFETLLKKIYSSYTGRPSHPVLLLFKSLLLQTWYNLSDPQLEEAIDDRLSFRRFISLSVSKKAPDHSVFSRFRTELVKHELQERLFTELNCQLEKLGLVVKKGTLVDATVIEAASKKPPSNEDGTGGSSEREPEAKWTKKNGEYLFGYKAHLGIDQESGLVRQLEMTPANVHDGKMLASALSGDEEWVYADKAYDSRTNGDLLREKGILNGILFRASRNKPLDEVKRFCNRILSRFRSSVERVFGTLKRSYNYRRGRYFGLLKNRLQLTLMCMAYNMRKMEKLCA